MIDQPDTAANLVSGLVLCARPTVLARPATKSAAAVAGQRACSHERRWHAPCTAIVTPGSGKKAAEICGCPAFVEPGG